MVGVEEHLVAGGVGPEERGHGIHHGQLDVLPSPSHGPGEQGRGDGLRGEQGGDLVGRRLA